MAYIKFFVKGTTNPAPIYVRLKLPAVGEYRPDFKRKTGCEIDPNDWSNTKGAPKPSSETTKNTAVSLLDMKKCIIEALNIATRNNDTINGDWLNEQIDKINNKEIGKEESPTLLVDHIQFMIDNAHNINNSKRELGLSDNRIKAYKTFKGTITRFQNEIYKGKSILIRNVNMNLKDDFHTWLKSKQYAPGYCGKNLSELKAVCRHAKSKGIEVSNTLDSITGYGDKKSKEEIIVLNEQEQEVIKNLKLEKKPHLHNVRLWLELACLTGQRYSDFVRLNPKNIRETKEGFIIHLEQKKGGGKDVTIPLFPRALEILKNEMPYVVSEQKLNKHLKEVCKLAGFNELVKGSKYLEADEKNSHKAKTKGEYKKYELVSSHIGRRSFATQHYGKLPTPLIMSVTGHKKESTFLQYVRVSSEDNANKMLEIWNKLKKSDDEDKKIKAFKKLIENDNKQRRIIKNLSDAVSQLANINGDSVAVDKSINAISKIVKILESDKPKTARSNIRPTMEVLKNAN